MPKYFEMTGKRKTAVESILAKRADAVKAFDKLARSLGCRNWCIEGLFHDRVGGFVAAKNKTPSAALRPYYDRKRKKYTEVLVPNLSNKEGKALQKELNKLRLPGAVDVNNLFKVPLFAGSLRLQLLGVTVYGPSRRVIVTAPDSVELPGHKRISDLAVERLQAAEKKRPRAKK